MTTVTKADINDMKQKHSQAEKELAQRYATEKAELEKRNLEELEATRFSSVLGATLMSVEYHSDGEGTVVLSFSNGQVVAFSASGDDATYLTFMVVNEDGSER